MQLTILCTCLSLCLTRDLQNFRCAITLLQGKVVTCWRYVANITCIFLEI